MPHKYKKFEDDEVLGVVFKPIKRMITVRLSPELHHKLKEEAHDNRIPMNTLCIEKLQQPITKFSWENDDQEKPEKGVQPDPGSDPSSATPNDGATEQSG